MSFRSIEDEVHDALQSDRSSLLRLSPLWQRGANYIQSLRKEAALVASMSPSLIEEDGSPVLHFEQEFNNWGKTVNFKPLIIMQPKTRVGLRNIVKWAKHYNEKETDCFEKIQNP